MIYLDMWAVEMMAKKRKASDEIEWAGTGENPEDWVLEDGHYALDSEDAQLLGKYFREARVVDPDIQARVADLLDPPSKNRTRLVYRNRRGRPVSARKGEASIRDTFPFALKRNMGKTEAAVAEVMKNTGKSRSTIFAAKARLKNPKSKKP